VNGAEPEAERNDQRQMPQIPCLGKDAQIRGDALADCTLNLDQKPEQAIEHVLNLGRLLWSARTIDTAADNAVLRFRAQNRMHLNLRTFANEHLYCVRIA
jgi:hypothetical protein